MNYEEYDVEIFNNGKLFLLSCKGISEEILNQHIYMDFLKPVSINLIYKRIIESSQNKNMNPGVIKGTIESIDKLDSILSNFEPTEILKKYPNDNYNKLLEDIIFSFKLEGKINETNSGTIPRLCKTIIEAAKFIEQFRNVDEFYNWVDKFYKDETLRPALPPYLSYEIYGLGVALSCDFLKELGFVEYSKPDIHLKDIFDKLNLSQTRSDRDVILSINRIARNNKVNPYTVDKLFWLIGSGFFYLSNIKIGSQKIKFINQESTLKRY